MMIAPCGRPAREPEDLPTEIRWTCTLVGGVRVVFLAISRVSGVFISNSTEFRLPDRRAGSAFPDPYRAVSCANCAFRHGMHNRERSCRG